MWEDVRVGIKFETMVIYFFWMSVKKITNIAVGRGKLGMRFKKCGLSLNFLGQIDIIGIEIGQIFPPCGTERLVPPLNEANPFFGRNVAHPRIAVTFYKDSPANGTSATMPAGISELMGGW